MKMIRVTLRDGTTRIQHIPEGMGLQQVWRHWRADGDAIGETWCAQFDAISHADMVDVHGDIDHRVAEQEKQAQQPLGIASFGMKFPHEA